MDAKKGGLAGGYIIYTHASCDLEGKCDQDGSKRARE